MLPPLLFTLTGTYTSGFELPVFTRVLSITSTGYVEGDGVSAGNSSSGLAIYNDGRVNGAGSGIDLAGLSATVTNGDSAHTAASIIGGFDGIYGSYVKVSNFGTIKVLHSDGYPGAAVLAATGGVVINGSASDMGALIDAGSAGFNAGVNLETKGAVSNFGTIRGVLGVVLGAGTVTNSGTIAAADTGDAKISVGVAIDAGGAVTNGSAQDTTALIEGAHGVLISGGYGAVNNFGSIVGTYLGSYVPASGDGGYAGVRLEDGGSVTNGAATDTTSRIAGGDGVWIQGYGTLTNYGQIAGQAGKGYGVRLDGGGHLVNGASGDGAALIQGDATGVVLGGFTYFTNFGTVAGGAYGVLAKQGGSLGNYQGGLIEGQTGVLLGQGAELGNGGSILATGGYGAKLYQNALLSNGYHAVVQGSAGVYVGADCELDNYGTVVGTGGVAVTLSAATSRLLVGSGAVFKGAVEGGGGALDLDASGGVISGLSGGGVTVSGSMPVTRFTNFGAVSVGQLGNVDSDTASFNLRGAGAVVAGDTLTVLGTLGVASSLAVSGTLRTYGVLSGPGTLSITNSGRAVFSYASVTLEHVTMSGNATVEADSDLSYAGKWNQSAGTLTATYGYAVTFTGAGDSFSGNLEGAIDFAAGTQTLKGATVDDAVTVTFGSTIKAAGLVTVAAGDTTMAAGLITFSSDSALDDQGGTIEMAGAGASFTGGDLDLGVGSRVIGASATSTLTNVGSKFIGAGQLGAGRMKLINRAAGVIAADSAGAALVIDTGSNTITNAGQIESLGKGGLMIESAVNNSGQIIVTGGLLTASQAITGAGAVRISGGTADFASSFSEKVSFGATGVLELAKSQSYAGTISGFSKTGATSLDLLDIAFGAKTKATYVGTTTAGTLTVTDGTHTARIKFAGNYSATTFTAASDGHGGTTVVDTAGASASATRFVAAMAAFGANSPGVAVAGPGALRGPEPMLTAPSS